MKTYRNLIISVALLFTVGAAARAEAPAANPAAVPMPAKKHQSRLDTLSEKLSLTDEQKQKVALILKDEQASAKQLKKDVSVPNDLKKSRTREIVDAHDAQIRALLTADQVASFDQLEAKYPSHVKM